MSRKHKIRITVRITSQTAYNLDRLAKMSGMRAGRVIDKLIREKMISLKTGGKDDGQTADTRRAQARNG